MDIERVVDPAWGPPRAYRVKSRSRPGVTHKTVVGWGFASCTCEDFFYHVTKRQNAFDYNGPVNCAHVTAAFAKAMAERAAEKKAAAAPSAPVTITITVDPTTGKVSTTR